MAVKNIPYKRCFWVIGTTSFRTAKLNLKIERQLLLLSEFYQMVSENQVWQWNDELQVRYYDFLLSNGFISGNAKLKDKDAREKTSGLVEIGLLDDDRRITEAGQELLSLASQGNFVTDNIFSISADSFVYFKQLLKTSIELDGNYIRPLLVVIKCLVELHQLSYEEFTYLIPLIKDEDSCRDIIGKITEYRKENSSLTIEDIIYDRLMTMDNYHQALQEFISNEVTENLICLIGMNRKSRTYDKTYYTLYNSLLNVFFRMGTDGEKTVSSKDVEILLETTKALKLGTMWRNLLFASTSVNVIRNDGMKAIKKNCPFRNCSNELELKKEFFKYLHVFKAKATMGDYCDLNKRYLSLADIIIFEDSKISLDILPSYYFAEVISTLQLKMFTPCEELMQNVSLPEVSSAFNLGIDVVYRYMSDDYGVDIETLSQAVNLVKSERYRRFNELLDQKFTDKILVELLDCFEKRNDKRIEELVTDNATIPTIFEYILGIIWYKVSRRQGNILDYMKLSLESNLLPKTHAAGGAADIVYEYASCLEYPAHSLLIEATLSDKANQRRMEMEPVSRHLGEYRHAHGNPYDYSLFVSTYLDDNVVIDFRYRKIVPYKKNEAYVSGLKIISLDTKALKRILEIGVKYDRLYGIFQEYYDMDLGEDDVWDWQTNLVKEATTEYNHK